MNYATREAVKEMAAVQNAREEVAPFVGNIPAMDSAGAVYLAALERMGHDTSGVGSYPAAAKALFHAWRSHGALTRPTRRPAMDAAATTKRAEMFPNGGRLR